MADKKRVSWIDCSKAIAIMLVIFEHFIISTSEYNSHFENIIMVIISTFHMPLFFILSGMVYRQDVFVSFIKKKIIRLLLPYLLFCFLYFCSSILYYLFLGKASDYLYAVANVDNIANTLLINSNSIFSGYWFLPVLFVALVGYSLVLKVNNIYQVLILIFGIGIAVECGEQRIMLPFGIGEAMLAMPFIFIGHKIKQLNYSVIEDKFLLIKMLPIWGGGIWYWKYKEYGNVSMYNSIVVDCNFFYLLGITGSLLSIALIRHIIIQNTILSEVFKTIGVNSLYIYGLHYFFVGGMIQVFKVQLIEYSEYKIVFEIIGTVLTVVLCMVIIRITNRLLHKMVLKQYPRGRNK